MGPDSFSWRREGGPGSAVVQSTQTAKIILRRVDLAPVLQEGGFQDHLGEGHVVVHPLPGRLLDIEGGDEPGKTGPQFFGVCRRR
jgi:hypothetical protein